MLNPELYEEYDKVVVDEFKEVARVAESEDCNMIVYGMTTTYGVRAPELIVAERKCPGVNIFTITDIFERYVPKATPAQRDMFGDISYVEYADGYEKLKGESIQLWVCQ